MKRFNIRPITTALGFSLLAVFFVAGCAAEETTGETESEQTSDGVRMVGLDGNGDEQVTIADPSDRPVQQGHATNPSKLGCPGCGPVPDPWKSIHGPVPDPWATTPPSPNPGSSSGGSDSSGTDGNGKKP